MSTDTAQRTAIRAAATDEALVLFTSEGVYSIPWEECSQRLAEANTSQRAVLDLSPSGYGIHWPLIDEDLAIDPLIRARRPDVA